MNRRSRIERLAKREERETIQRIVKLSIISIIIGVLFFTLGFSILAKLADFLGGTFKKNDVSQNTQTVQAPNLDDLPNATNSAKLKISGFASDGKSVEIYLNDEKVINVDILDNKFEYSDLNLKKGENKIAAKAVFDGKTSDSSTVKKIFYDNEEPKLEVETPFDGQNFSGNNRVRVSGKTDEDNQVYANGFLASVNQEGKFEVLIPVSEGETTIEVKAVDFAGNTKVEKRKINFRN